MTIRFSHLVVSLQKVLGHRDAGDSESFRMRHSTHGTYAPDHWERCPGREPRGTAKGSCWLMVEHLGPAQAQGGVLEAHGREAHNRNSISNSNISMKRSSLCVVTGHESGG